MKKSNSLFTQLHLLRKSLEMTEENKHHARR